MSGGLPCFQLRSGARHQRPREFRLEWQATEATFRLIIVKSMYLSFQIIHDVFIQLSNCRSATSSAMTSPISDAQHRIYPFRKRHPPGLLETTSFGDKSSGSCKPTVHLWLRACPPPPKPSSYPYDIAVSVQLLLQQLREIVEPLRHPDHAYAGPGPLEKTRMRRQNHFG